MVFSRPISFSAKNEHQLFSPVQRKMVQTANGPFLQDDSVGSGQKVGPGLAQSLKFPTHFSEFPGKAWILFYGPVFVHRHKNL